MEFQAEQRSSSLTIFQELFNLKKIEEQSKQLKIYFKGFSEEEKQN